MELVTIQSVSPKYTHGSPSNVVVFDFEEFEDQLQFKPVSKSIVKIAPGGFGGNHKHQQVESWIAFGGELELSWMVGDKRVSLVMNPVGRSKSVSIFTIASQVPHVIRNISKTDGYLLEWGDMEMMEKQDVDVMRLDLQKEKLILS